MTTGNRQGEMHILMTNTSLSNRTGSELYIKDVAQELSRRGHHVSLYSPRLGSLAEDLRRQGLSVYGNLADLDQAPDIIHGQHHLETMTALSRFPHTPVVHFCHGAIPWEEIPPIHPRILHYVAVSAFLQRQLVDRYHVPAPRTHLIPNFVDLSRFRPRAPLPPFPEKALAFSNQISNSNIARLIRSACWRQGVRLKVLGMANRTPSDAPEEILPSYDIVFARGRSALEALACGVAVICCDVEGMGPIVTTQNFERLYQANFGLSILQTPVSTGSLIEELRRYDARDAAEVFKMAREVLDMRHAVDSILDVYSLAREDWRPHSIQDHEAESASMFHYLDFLSRSLRRPPRAWPAISQAVAKWLSRNRVRLRIPLDLLAYVRCRVHRRFSPGRSEAVGFPNRSR